VNERRGPLKCAGSMITDMEWNNKRVLVFGSGISGIAAAVLLDTLNARPVIYDGNGKLDPNDIIGKVNEKAGRQCNVEVILGEFPEKRVKELDLVVLSPGIPCDIPLVSQFRDNNIEIIGEIELAYLTGKGSVYAITGTNGKTTSTTLLGEIMKAHFPEVYVVGNIGSPYTEASLRQSEKAVTVAEISSFQLETVKTFKPHAAAITNITPDHLNRHHSMEEYIRVKKLINMNQTEDDAIILNYEDEVLRQFGKEAKGRVIFFSAHRRLKEGLYYTDGKIIAADGESETVLVNADELQLLGLHNFENIMTAAGIALFAGVDIETVRQVIKDFKGVEHRIEFVGEINGIRYYNDSKGTNPDAAIKAIQAMNRPTLLIGGGYDKESSYEDWINSFDGKVKKFVLIGQTKEKIADAAKRCGFPEKDIVICEDLKEAVGVCKKEAQSGDAVLLSPACASWGQFDNYEQRGRRFKELVRN
jgi:UDP-N-acetylmuramoylalanine--D-glutamate ligase